VSDFLPDIALVAESGLDVVRKDPIRAFRCSSEGQKQFLAALSLGEAYARTGNQGGKTLIGATAGVALARGEAAIDGVALPQLPTPCVGAVLIKSKAQGVESVVQAYIQQVGNWPHHVAYSNAGLGYVQTIYVKPRTSQSADHKTWSRINFYSEDSEMPVGLRLDWVHADEPPKEEVWRELRARGRANRRFVRFITATPFKRADWQWLLKDFPESQTGRLHKGRIEVRWTIYDNRALSVEHIRKLEEDWENDPLRDARLRGDYVDTSGAKVFNYRALQQALKRCVPPLYVDEFGVEVFEEPVPGHDYVVPMDPSSGVEGGDRCGMWVVDKHTRRGVARYFGYKTAYELGALGRFYCERYNNGMAIPEMNGGYGEAVVIGLDGWRNVYLGMHEDRLNGQRQNRIGWYTTVSSKGTILNALQRALREESLFIPSADAIDSLMQIDMDETQKLIRYPGQNHEDMILLGLAAHVTEQIPVRKPRESLVKGYTTMSEFIRVSLGLKPREKNHGPIEAWR